MRVAHKVLTALRCLSDILVVAIIVALLLHIFCGVNIDWKGIFMFLKINVLPILIDVGKYVQSIFNTAVSVFKK